MAQTYQIALRVESEPTALSAAFLMASVVLDGYAFGLVWEKCLLDPTGRLRVTLSGPLPQDQFEAYRGEIVVVGGGG